MTKAQLPPNNLSPKHYIKRYKQRKWTLKHCVLGLQVSSSTLSIRASCISSRFFENQPNEICSRWEKAMVSLLIFKILLLLAGKKLLDAKGPFDNNVFKNPARTSWKMRSIDAKWPETTSATSKWHALKDCRILWKHLADFLKTYLTKFAVIWVKRGQKAGFLSPRSSKI